MSKQFNYVELEIGYADTAEAQQTLRGAMLVRLDSKNARFRLQATIQEVASEGSNILRLLSTRVAVGRPTPAPAWLRYACDVFGHSRVPLPTVWSGPRRPTIVRSN